MSLTRKQELFCQEYLVDLNATRAIERAGFNPKNENTASSNGYDLLRKPEIQARIQELMKARSDRTSITADKVLREFARIGFSDITDVVRLDTNNCIELRDINTLNKDITASIQSITSIKTTTTDKDGNEVVTSKISVKLHDKSKSLEQLAKHTGIAFDLNWAIATMRKYGYMVVLDPDTQDCFIRQGIPN